MYDSERNCCSKIFIFWLCICYIKNILLELLSVPHCHHNFDYMKIFDRCVYSEAVSGARYFE